MSFGQSQVNNYYVYDPEHGRGALDLSGGGDCGAVPGVCGVYEEVISFARGVFGFAESVRYG